LIAGQLQRRRSAGSGSRSASSKKASATRTWPKQAHLAQPAFAGDAAHDEFEVVLEAQAPPGVVPEEAAEPARKRPPRSTTLRTRPRSRGGHQHQIVSRGRVLSGRPFIPSAQRVILAFVTFDRIELVRDGPVARVWLARPEVRNAFDGRMVSELRKALFELADDDAVRVIVLGGRGPAFCAGADLAWMTAMAGFTLEENRREAQAMADLFLTVYESPKPVVARVHGAALGGGSGLVAACDVPVAAEGTRFGFTEARLGIIPAVISPFVLRKIGESAARELFLTGERFDAAKAREIGLVRAVVPEAELDAAVQGRVDELLQAGPEAIDAAKDLIREVAFRRVEDVQRYTIERIADLRVSEEGQEGMKAFLEKRKPRWAP
jgi:methylglutaconyl-CoA hydratase